MRDEKEEGREEPEGSVAEKKRQELKSGWLIMRCG
jgi:hypothetical protein